MLGKRARRPPIKRTTSMTEFNWDLTAPTNNQPQNGGSAASTLRQHRCNSAHDFVETSHFLRICFLCQRRLVHGHDIYMYRGDSAFCSLECRQQQMVQDERIDKCSMASKKDAGPPPPPPEDPKHRPKARGLPPCRHESALMTNQQ